MTTAQGTPSPAPAGSRAGRNLPVAIASSLAMGGVVLLSLLVRKEAFLLVIAVAVGASVWELTSALGTRRLRPPVVPLMVGSVAVPLVTYVAGSEGLLVSVALTVLAAAAWRLLDPPRVASGEPHADPATALVRDVTASALVVGWLPLLAGFAALLLHQPHGAQRVLVLVLGAVFNDVGGYTAGVLWGKHPMAPTVSPKKSWEGFAGSAVTCLVGGVLAVHLMLGGPWWAGAVVGAVGVAVATMGDLAESILKRDLGIKDMGSLLPGHGGVLDRIDALLATAPVVWLLLAWLVPAAS